jgi:hypothetical protein
VVGDHRGDQADIVGVLAVTGADLALPLRVGKLLIGDLVLCDAVLGRVDDARARGQAEPVAVRIAILGRDVLVDDVALDLLRDAAFLGFRQAGDVDRQDDVGRRVRAFRLDALHQALVEEEHVGGDPGFLGEFVEQRLDQVRLTVGVDVDFTICEGGCGKRQTGCREGKGGEGRLKQLHLVLLGAFILNC